MLVLSNDETTIIGEIPNDLRVGNRTIAEALIKDGGTLFAWFERNGQLTEEHYLSAELRFIKKRGHPDKHACKITVDNGQRTMDHVPWFERYESPKPIERLFDP